MTYFLYILQNPQEHWYIGISQNVDKRLSEHNTGQVKSTKGRGPYKIVYLEKYPDKTTARKREILIKKSGRIRKELKEQINAKAPSSIG